MITQLGDDLLVEILIRLPDPRPACRCKSVCKRWSSLISTPSFNRRLIHHHHRSWNQLPLPEDPNELQSTVRSFLPRVHIRDELRVLDCFKDWVLCGFWDLEDDNHESRRSYLVCNPFTKQWVALPLAPKKHVDYAQSLARKFDLGDDEQAFVYSSEYRFRVVCIYNVGPTTMLDVFCSESWKWTREILAIRRCLRIGNKTVVSCNGELFWSYHKFEDLKEDRLHGSVAAFNPFRLDIPPTSIDVSAFDAKPWWVISGSQGALHVIAFEGRVGVIGWLSSVWRLEEDRRSWRKLCEGLVCNKKSRCGKYRVERCHLQLCLHPCKPEVLLFNWLEGGDANAILSWDLQTEEVEFFAELEGGAAVSCIMVFHPRVHCWPTSIQCFRDCTLPPKQTGNIAYWARKGRRFYRTKRLNYHSFNTKYLIS
ncbi:unnamed protein product [Linum tenue]|uniref:F-box domain-containing protein n=1 Tax=Linum tenue TaxID=586396 RepID=A0AAV0QZE1_9ROSI|nr:unnamed protein product [Linum tenue]